MTWIDAAIVAISIAAFGVGMFASVPPAEEARHRALDGSRCHDNTTTNEWEDVS